MHTAIAQHVRYTGLAPEHCAGDPPDTARMQASEDLACSEKHSRPSDCDNMPKTNRVAAALALARVLGFIHMNKEVLPTLEGHLSVVAGHL